MFLFDALLSLFFPRECLVCGSILSDQDKEICHICLNKLPYTTYRLNQSNDVFHHIIPFVDIEAATALFFFTKQGMIQELMHQLKYQGHQELGKLFGNILGDKMIADNPGLAIDYVVPIPLHPKKLKKRGYNQLSLFGKTLAEVINAEFEENVLYKKIANETQTKKNALQRKENVKGVFGLRNPDKFIDKHLLLIDDVITTGATLVEAALTLKRIGGVKISIATIATADQL